MYYSRRGFIVLAAGGLVSACETAQLRLPDSRALSAPSFVSVRSGGRIVRVPLEEYVVGSALAEAAPTTEPEAAIDRIFEVQAILARSYAASNLGRHGAEGFDVCDTTHCQVYDPARLRSSRFAPAARAAAERTAGVLLTYGQRPAAAFFHSDCGGHTAAPETVWGVPPIPYLTPMTDALPAGRVHHEWTFSVANDALLSSLNADARTRVGRTLRDVDITTRDSSGRAAHVTIGGETPRAVRGEELRSIVNQRFGERAIQSTRFTVQRSGRTYVFRGTGYGHGVGLCQLGAAVRARRGESAAQILSAYFKGATLTRTRA